MRGELAKLGLRRRLSGLDMFRQHGGTPVHGGAKLPVVQRRAVGPGRGRGQMRGGSCWLGHLAGLHRAPHRAVNLVIAALLSLHIPWLEQQMPGKAARLDPGLLEGGFHIGVTLHRGRIIGAHPVDGTRAGCGHQRRDHLARGARPQDQPRSFLRQRLGKNLQPLVKPPFGCGAQTVHRVVAQEDRDHRPAARHRRRQRRVVRKPQIPADPDDDGGLLAHVQTLRWPASRPTQAPVRWIKERRQAPKSAEKFPPRWCNA